MNDIVICVLSIIKKVTYWIINVFVIFGMFELIVGYDRISEILEKIHFPLSYKQMIIIAFSSLAIQTIVRILLYKLTGIL